ncbi:MAG TPA: hypothetical protein VNJ12_12120 [Candidatus Dormibacteraeota bacterium]|nr:hypothetical protein [Candidatus Dormibacteraeota bacterium]
MRYFEQIIRRYEHKRWAAENNRSGRPFDWGIEHIGGPDGHPDPRAFLDRFAVETTRSSDLWFAAEPPDDARLRDEADGKVLTFTSAVRSPWAENNLVWARYFPSPGARAAVVVLPQWNAGWDAHAGVCRWLNRFGMSALKMSLPYHDRRAVGGMYRDNFLVGPNIGLTLQANRQAVTDVRRCLRWLERRGYARLGVLGTSIGSAIACITTAHDPSIRAGAFLHVSTSFGEVVSTGMTTMHVWEPMRAHVSRDEIRHFWAPISPYPYAGRLAGSGQKLLMISGRYDPTFWPEFSEGMFGKVLESGADLEILRLPCGHYSLDRPPFSFIAGLRFGAFLRDRLVL